MEQTGILGGGPTCRPGRGSLCRCVRAGRGWEASLSRGLSFWMSEKRSPGSRRLPGRWTPGRRRWPHWGAQGTGHTGRRDGVSLKVSALGRHVGATDLERVTQLGSARRDPLLGLRPPARLPFSQSRSSRFENLNNSESYSLQGIALPSPVNAFVTGTGPASSLGPILPLCSWADLWEKIIRGKIRASP